MATGKLNELYHDKTTLKSNESSKGASLIGIEDAGSIFDATTVEGALAEIKTELDRISGEESPFVPRTGAHMEGSLIFAGQGEQIVFPHNPEVDQGILFGNVSIYSYLDGDHIRMTGALNVAGDYISFERYEADIDIQGLQWFNVGVRKHALAQNFGNNNFFLDQAKADTSLVTVFVANIDSDRFSFYEDHADGKVSIGHDSPSSTFDVSGSVAYSAATIDDTDSPYTIGSTHLLLCDASGGAITVNLPASSGVTGRTYHIKKTDSSANTITIDGNSSETIDGSTTASLTTQYQSVMILCDGSNWHII